MSAPKPQQRRPAKVNREGLRFFEWFNAANLGGKNAVDEKTARRAWKDGEDPTEYAAGEPVDVPPERYTAEWYEEQRRKGARIRGGGQ